MGCSYVESLEPLQSPYNNICRNTGKKELRILHTHTLLRPEVEIRVFTEKSRRRMAKIF
jgi:hypothetical protein